MELQSVLRSLRAAWWLLAIGVVLGGVLALLFSLFQTRQYTSYTQLFVAARNSSTSYDALTGSQLSQERVTSYARLITGEELADRVIDRLGLDRSAADLSANIAASAQAETVLIDIAVIDTSPERAQEIAIAVGQEFAAFAEELETPPEGGQSPVTVTVTDQPEIPTEASSPQTARNITLGVVIGLLIGAASAIARSRLDRSVKDPEEATSLAGAPVIGTVIRDDLLGERHTIDQVGASRTVEDYRQLRTNLQFLNVDEPPKVVMVSSALPSEGKTTAVVNLALALADAGRRVTIVEADLRKPKVTRYLGLVGGVGLTNVLSGSADVEDVLQKHGSGDLYVIAAGPTPPNPGELLSSSHMFTLLDKLRSENDFVLVDAPPLLPVADSTGLSVYMDGVLLSVRYGSTRKEQLQQAAATLQRVGAKTLGVILNIVPPKAELATAYGYGYSYGYEADRRPPS